MPAEPGVQVVDHHVPVLEIGGTHVTAAWIDVIRLQVGAHYRADLDSAGSAAEILATLVGTADRLDGTGESVWSIAIPGPFDYDTGVAKYVGVGKFDRLRGMNLGSELRERLRYRPAGIRFINDAGAFAIGEWVIGAARGYHVSAAITLGTGIGSAFLRDGVPVDTGPDVPPHAEVHLLNAPDGQPIEEAVSRRAIIRAYQRQVRHEDDIDVREIADRARAGDRQAAAVLSEAFSVLGATLAPWLHRFGAEVLVVGGSISRAWDLIEDPLAQALSVGWNGVLRLAMDRDHSSLIGAAYAVAAEHKPDRVKRPQ